MADIEKGLPVRTEDDADQKVQVKVVDATTVAQTMEVDTDGNAHVEAHGNNPAGGDEVLRLSELGAPNGDGDYDVTNNTKPASAGLIVHDQQATPNDTHQNVRVTGVSNSTIHAAHVAVVDDTGAPFSSSNPLPVAPDVAGDPSQDYNTATVASEATNDHDLSVANNTTANICGIIGSASSRAKWELQLGDGAASEAFSTIAVKFSTESNPNVFFDFSCAPLEAVGTSDTRTVKLIRENRDDDDSMDVYSTFIYNLES